MSGTKKLHKKPQPEAALLALCKYLDSYNNVRVRKYISLSIPLVHNSWAARSVSQVSMQLHFLLG